MKTNTVNSALLLAFFQNFAEVLLLYFFIGSISESQKCLYNLILQHTKSREILSRSCMAEAILHRLNAETLDPSLFPIYLFDLKILFIITAKCEEVR